jgi:hypothetical protein
MLLQSRLSLLLALLFCFFETSFFAVTASSSVPNPQAHPQIFTNANPMPTTGPSYPGYIARFKSFLSSTAEGQLFIKEVLQDDANRFPINLTAFRSSNTVMEYQAWYNSKFAVSGASKAALEEEARKREAAEQLAKQIEIEAAQKERALVRKHEEEKEQTLATHKASMVAILAGGGGDFTNAQVNELVTAISTAEHIQVDGMAFDDTAKSVDVFVTINGTPHNLNVTGLHQGEYNRLKLFLAMFAKMHSAAFNAASGAMSDLITDILSSAQPQDYHFSQIAQLASTSSRLEGYLKYHGDLNKKLTDSHALPLSNFLKIRFLSPADVERARSQVAREFQAIQAVIQPDPTALPLGSQALDKFLKKIDSSIKLPTEAEFSKEEIEEIFKELGLLLETDGGEIVIDSQYFNKLLEFSQKFTALKKAMLSKNKELYESAPVKAALEAIEGSILAAHPELPVTFDRTCAEFNDAMKIGIAYKGLQKIPGELLAIPDRSLSMPLQDAGLATAALKAGRADVVPIQVQAVLFLLQTFAKDQLDIVKKFSIVGNLDPAIQAACSAYYGYDLQEIRQTLLRSNGFAFSEENYKKLKGSENVAFMKHYLDSVMSSKVTTVDLDALKQSVLNIQTDFSARLKTGLMLRTCELMNSSEFKQRLSVKEAVEISEKSAYFDNPAIADAVLQYELQDNALKTEEDKKKFLDSYINVKLLQLGGVTEVEYAEKIARLNAFFTQSLAATAKDADLVKLVLTLPMLKQSYGRSHHDLCDTITTFTEPDAGAGLAMAGAGAGLAMAGGASAKNMVIEGLLKKFDGLTMPDQDQKLVGKRILEKLRTIQAISKDFLAMGNSAGAITVASPHAASSGPSFRVTVGLSQLDFDAVFANHDYNVFYNAVKILHFIELTMPSDDELETLKALMLSSMPATADATEKQRTEDQLTGTIQIARDLRLQSVDFYKQITALMQFVEDFQKQKDKYNEPSGTEGIDFYANIDHLGSASVVSAKAGAIALAGQIERFYEDTELQPLIGLNGGNPMILGDYKKFRREGKTPAEILDALKTKYPDINIPAKYEGQAASAAPAVGLGGANKFIYATLSPMRSLLSWLNKSEQKLKEEMTAALAAAGAPGSFNETSVKIQTHYVPLMQMQIAYLRDIDFSKLKKEEDILYLVRQLLTCVDLHLRIKEHEKFIADIALIPLSQPTAKKDLERKLKAFEAEYLHPTKYTVGHIVKPYKTPAALNDQQTNDLLKKVKTVNSDLKKLIGNTIIEAFESGSTDIITPVLTVIDSYAGA